ncbi:MAG: DEAD/DEAH box helicase [Bacillota bacterium]|nr:DEAD/DEAH box helicase [Bacillota bacterium]
MKETINQKIQQSLISAFIDSGQDSYLEYRPQFLTNDARNGIKVLTTIEEELQKCKSFSISVAFITMSGIEPLKQTLKELEKKGIRGRILTTDYLLFSEPRALEFLSQFSNIELKMYRTDQSHDGFHTKGYIFRSEEVYKIIVGSSNFTQSALTRNKEWNTYLVSTEKGELIQYLNHEFELLFYSDYAFSYEEFIDEYTSKYDAAKEQRRLMKNQSDDVFVQELKPNSMQEAFINNLVDIRSKNEDRALLISATGTGKTYASAFAMKDMNEKRVLFLVHREQIAKQALASYKRVFGKNRSYGLLSGNSKQYAQDYLFSTMQMMSKDETLNQFDPYYFDTIIIDEVHRAGASSYQKIMNYFKPKFWLGMSASPERSDGFDIYNLFNHNIAYEIRLNQALEEDLLCPFHYFGISDIEIDGEVLDDVDGLKHFNKLVCEERVDYILSQAEYYGYSGNRVKGLIFVSRKEEGMELSRRFNEKGYRTVFLSGDDSQQKREEMIDRLVNDDRKDNLDYIFTVDIFNEGIDIVQINQIIMLRPTQSAIIFVQQLGRGLRKAEDKEFVVILDFIGNYKNNFLIPIALSGDRSYNKDTVRRFVSEGTKVIPGASTIHFDEVTKKQIFKSIDQANFSDVRIIKESYQQLRFKLGRIPSLMDFEKYASIDPLRIFDSNSLGSYHKFLSKYEKEYKVRFSPTEEKVLEFISKKLANGKRKEELLILQQLLEKEECDLNYSNNLRTNLVNVLTNNFPTGTGKNTYKECVFITGNKISQEFKALLVNEEFRAQVEEIIEYGLFRNEKDYKNTYKYTPFSLYAKYTYEDVCRLLEWEKGEVPLNIGGYKYDKKTKTYPVFINYDKDEAISDTIKYEDRLLSPNELLAISKSKRTIQSEDVYTALHAKELGVTMHLFVRKNKDDKISKEFYYLGTMNATGEAHEFVMPNTSTTAVEIFYQLDTPVRKDIYDYIVNV